MKITKNCDLIFVKIHEFIFMGIKFAFSIYAVPSITVQSLTGRL